MFAENELKTFDSIEAEVSFYKMKYYKHKFNIKQFKQTIEKSNKDKFETLQQYEMASNDLINEKVLRKNLEEKLIMLVKADYENKERICKLEKENQDKQDIINAKCKNKNRNVEDNKCEILINHDFMKSYLTFKENAMKNLLNKFDYEKIKKSLIIDFLDFDRDSSSFKKKIKIKEEQLLKIEKILMKWVEVTENLEKVIENFCNIMSILGNSLIADFEIFDDCPDSISLIYSLNGLINDLISQYRVFMNSIKNWFLSPIKEFISSKFSELKESRISSIKVGDEFIQYAGKFLSTKKIYIKENQRENYNVIFRTYQFSKYDYISSVNSILLYMKIDLPEKISLVIYAFLSLFKQNIENLATIEENVKANLEKISVKFNEKDKIIDEFKKQKLDLVKTLDIPNTFLDTKEGILSLKTKDKNYFKKCYVKIFKGDLIFYKLQKGSIDNFDLTKPFNLCNLLLSNVKRNDKEYDYSFCFEIISAANIKAFMFQAETEREAEEWVSSIRNAIASSISNYKNLPNKNESFTQTKKENRLLDNSNNQTKSSDNILSGDKNGLQRKNNEEIKKIIEKLTNQSKCMDCNSENPVWCSINWLSLFCIDCSGIHRSLGVQYTKVRSLRLDNIDLEFVEIIDYLGCENINKILEANCKSSEKPKPSSDINFKQKFITTKYKDKGFLKSPLKTYRSKINAYEYVFKCIESENLLELFCMLKIEEIDLDTFYDYLGEKYGIAHYAAKLGKFKVLKLLYCLNLNLESQDSKNLKPIDYALISKNEDILDFFKKFEEKK